jgi:hypothetical protein
MIKNKKTKLFLAGGEFQGWVTMQKDIGMVILLLFFS